VPRSPGDAWPPDHASRVDHRFGGPEVLDVVDPPDPVPGDGEHLYEVSAAGINDADTHQRVS
jgi:NADPH:quinone reductase-like Zn-dependent oxidoreductase